MNMAEIGPAPFLTSFWSARQRCLVFKRIAMVFCCSIHSPTARMVDIVALRYAISLLKLCSRAAGLLNFLIINWTPTMSLYTVSMLNDGR